MTNIPHWDAECEIKTWAPQGKNISPHLSALQKMFSPPMPGDVMVNFYINLSKLCLTVYQLHVLPPNTTKVSQPPLRPFIKSQWAAHVTQRFAFCRWSLELQACRELRLAQPRSHVVSKALVSFPFACRTSGSWGEDRAPLFIWISPRQRAEQQPLRGEPRAQGGVRGALAQRHPGVLHHLPAALPAAQRQGGCLSWATLGKYTVNIVLMF